MNQYFLINISDPCLGYLHIALANSRMKGIEGSVYIIYRYLSIIHKGQTCHPTSGQCLSYTGTYTSQTEDCDPGPPQYISHSSFGQSLCP